MNFYSDVEMTENTEKILNILRIHKADTIAKKQILRYSQFISAFPQGMYWLNRPATQSENTGEMFGRNKVLLSVSFVKTSFFLPLAWLLNILTYIVGDTKVIHCSASVCLSPTCRAEANTQSSECMHASVSKHFLLYDVLRSSRGMRVCVRADSSKLFTL